MLQREAGACATGYRAISSHCGLSCAAVNECETECLAADGLACTDTDGSFECDNVDECVAAAAVAAGGGGGDGKGGGGGGKGKDEGSWSSAGLSSGDEGGGDWASA